MLPLMGRVAMAVIGGGVLAGLVWLIDTDVTDLVDECEAFVDRVASDDAGSGYEAWLLDRCVTRAKDDTDYRRSIREANGD